jgi:hypothetical protein
MVGGHKLLMLAHDNLLNIASLPGVVSCPQTFNHTPDTFRR